MNTYLNAQRDVQYEAPPLLAKWLESFKEFPPRARGASFSIDQVVEEADAEGLSSFRCGKSQRASAWSV
jgi:hypothetical protein